MLPRVWISSVTAGLFSDKDKGSLILSSSLLLVPRPNTKMKHGVHPVKPFVITGKSFSPQAVVALPKTNGCFATS